LALRTISDRLSEASLRSFVGRGAEIDLIVASARAADPDTLVVFIHGTAGIGKTSLLTQAADAVAPAASILRLDCRDVEPTPGGMLAAIGAALGPTPGSETMDVGPTSARLASAAPRLVLMLDTYEVMAILDTWMRQVLVPALPESVLVVIAGRDDPSPGWLTASGWAGLVRSVRLGPLPRTEAETMLRQRGVADEQLGWALDLAHGHPLALELAAATLREQPERRIAAAASAAVIDALLDALLDRLPPDAITAVEAASTSRRITEPILRALLEQDDVRDDFEALRRLPFVEPSGEGLLMHDLVRETVARGLAARDPETHARYRRRGWRFFSAQAASPGARDRMWQVTADLIFLIENPVLRQACFPLGGGEHVVEPAVAVDLPEIERILAAQETAGQRSLLGRWLERHPESFAVARGPDGVDAFVQMIELGHADPSLLRDDPIAAAWSGHLRRHPVDRGQSVLLMRRWLGAATGEHLSPEVGACWLDVKRVYMELRPRLSRLYTMMVDLEGLTPIFGPLGFAPIGEPVLLEAVPHHPMWLDFGPGSVDGWLSRLVDAEIGADEAASAPAPVELDGLTAREGEILVLIAQGLSNRAIGERLVISEKTVGRHVANIFGKLGIHSRAQAARIAAERGLTGGVRGD
jgi:DNA-binding CsgD family transcriptional regulator